MGATEMQQEASNSGLTQIELYRSMTLDTLLAFVLMMYVLQYIAAKDIEEKWMRLNYPQPS